MRAAGEYLSQSRQLLLAYIMLLNSEVVTMDVGEQTTSVDLSFDSFDYMSTCSSKGPVGSDILV